MLVAILRGVILHFRKRMCDHLAKLPLEGSRVAIVEALVSSKKFSLILKLVNQVRTFRTRVTPQ